LLLNEQACFALYAASRAVTEVYRPLLADLDVTYPQYLVLLVLWERDAQPVKEIAAVLQLEYGTISPLLKRLETRGLVTRQRDADDERTVVVRLTPEGAALRARAAGIPQAIGCALNLDDQGRIALIETLRAITRSARGSTTEGETNA